MAALGDRPERPRAAERAAEHFRRREWDEAHRLYESARDALDPASYLRLAMATYLVGQGSACRRHLEDAYHRFVADEPAWAARFCFWLAYVSFERGEAAQGSGWVARGQRLLERHELDTVERGYLMVPEAIQLLYAGAPAEADERFVPIVDVAQRFDDVDLLTLGQLGRGQAMVDQRRFDEGLRLLDEAMVAVTADEVSPVIAGLVFCAVIEACQDSFDLRRAQEWTNALTAWCAAQPDLVPYRGQCQVHRVEVLRMHGAWRDAMAEAVLARRRLSEPPGHPAVGAAIYQEGELHRLRGQLQRAEEAYAEASSYGHDPQPGLARLRLAQGDVDAAVAGLRRALDESALPARRPRLLGTFVEVALAADDVAAAREAAEELAVVARQHEVPLLRALACQARAAVELAGGDVATALREARQAWSLWNEFGVPYEAARARVVVAMACRELGDLDAARLELSAARRAFRQLGAEGDVAELDRLTSRSAPRTDGLTVREVEVLRLVAEGRTNRSVADALHLSEKTVARHLSNIYTKLGISSRAAATAWAYEHELVTPG